MGLLTSIKSRFFPPELCRVAKTGDTSKIAECIARASVFVIGADVGDSVPFDADEESVSVMIETAAPKQEFDGSIRKYEINGDSFLPVFTDTAAAELFCGAYCGLLGHIHAFRLFKVPGEYIGQWIADQDIIVVNPQSANEVEIDRMHSAAIRESLPTVDSLGDAQFVSLAVQMVGISRTIEFAPNA